MDLHRLYDLVDRPGLRLPLAVAASICDSVRLASLCVIVRREGLWVHRRPGYTLVEPRMTRLTLDRLERGTADNFFYAYTPGPGDVVLDVGAGSGRDTLAFARKVGSAGRVVAIEAHPLMYRALELVRELNSLDWVTPVHAAIGGSIGQVRITDGENYSANTTLAGTGIPVPGRTLDDVVDALGIKRIDLLKMNIEGAERGALAGMARAIRMTRHVAISCHDFLADRGGGEPLRTTRDVVAFLHRHGFTVRRREDRREWLRDCVYGAASERQSRDPEPAAQVGG